MPKLFSSSPFNEQFGYIPDIQRKSDCLVVTFVFWTQDLPAQTMITRKINNIIEFQRWPTCKQALKFRFGLKEKAIFKKFLKGKFAGFFS